MTEDEAQAVFDETVARFAEDLETEGFSLENPQDPTKDWCWSGQIRAGNSRTLCEIEISDRFPFMPARAFLPEWDSRTRWHRERDGALCLWTDEDRAGLPWLDAKRLRAKAEAWIDADLLDWEGQLPAMDLEAYLETDPNQRFVLIEDWDSVNRKWLLFATDEQTSTRVVVSQVFSNTAPFKKHRELTAGIAVDIGEQIKPIGGWSDLEAQLADSLARDIAAWARQRGEVIVAARYTINAERGLFAASVRLDELGQPVLRGLIAADSTEHELAIRGGLKRSAYANKHVVVVGVGAVGSFLVDQLARAGVGKLTIYDPDSLLPGNSIRHLCPPQYFGWPKVAAVKAMVDERGNPGAVEIKANFERLTNLRTAVGLLDGADLVVDATGDGAAAQLLLEAVRFAVHQSAFLSVAVEGAGQFARVELVPTPAGEASLSIAGVEPFDPLISGGCGSPISPTPPSAVLATAGLAARCSLALLRNESIGAGRRESLEPIP